MIGRNAIAGLLDRPNRDGRLGDAVDGTIAGAVGSVALNLITYLDMAVRGRPASSAAEATAGRLTEKLHIGLGSEGRAANRRSGLGPLLGYALGTLSGAALAMVPRLPPAVAAGLSGAGLMLASNGAMTLLGITDPRRWSRTDWISDIVPHLGYGLAAAATLDRLRRSGR